MFFKRRLLQKASLCWKLLILSFLRDFPYFTVCAMQIEAYISSKFILWDSTNQILTSLQRFYQMRTFIFIKFVICMELCTDVRMNITLLKCDKDTVHKTLPRRLTPFPTNNKSATGNTLQWIQSVLTDRSQQVLVKGHASCLVCLNNLSRRCHRLPALPSIHQRPPWTTIVNPPPLYRW